MHLWPTDKRDAGGPGRPEIRDRLGPVIFPPETPTRLEQKIMAELTLDEAGGLAPLVSPAEAADRVDAGAVLIDVRSEAGRLSAGPLPGAIVVAKDEVASRFDIGTEGAVPALTSTRFRAPNVGPAVNDQQALKRQSPGMLDAYRAIEDLGQSPSYRTTPIPLIHS